MGTLFDAGKRKKEIAAAKSQREGVRERAEAVDKMLKENLVLSEASNALGEQLSASEPQSVHTIQYKHFRGRGSKWNIEHAQVGPDYVYQMFPLRPPKMNWKDVITHFIAAMDSIFPRSVSIKYAPPSERFQLKYYTIRVEGVTKLPGWEDAAQERALNALASVDAWPLPQT
jgi:hypothetical protein